MSEPKKRNRHNTKINMTTLLTILVLKILSEKVDEDHYGNKLIGEIEQKLEIYRPSPGIIYPILNNLEIEGAIKGHWDDPIKKSVKRYRVTDIGVKKLELLQYTYKDIIREEVKLLENIAKALDIKI